MLVTLPSLYPALHESFGQYKKKFIITTTTAAAASAIFSYAMLSRASFSFDSYAKQ